MWINVTATNFSITKFYREIFYENADPRIRDYPFMGNLLPIVLIYIFYVFFILYVMKFIMWSRKPIDITKSSAVLNFVLFLSCTYFFYESIEPWFYKFNWWCEPIDRSVNRFTRKVVSGSWMYLMSKFIYILESVLLALRKNYSQTQTYLLIHHTSFPLIIWSVINYFPGGHALFPGFINSFCHMLLFGFRFLFVNCFPNCRLYKYRKTVGLVIFIVQFLLIFLHTIQLFFWNDCGVPMGYVYLVVCYVIFITILLVTMVVPQL